MYSKLVSMYKKSIIVFALLLLLGNVAAAQGDGVYLSGKAGVSLMAFDNGSWWSKVGGDQTAQYKKSGDDTVFALGGAFGYGFDFPVRAEVEYMYRTNFEHDRKPTTNGNYNVDQDLTSHSVLLNLYYDFRNETALTPFVMAGGGVAVHTTDSTIDKIGGPGFSYEGREVTRTVFAWNVGLGIGYELNEQLAVDLLARYIDMGQARWENYSSGNDEAHSTGDITATEMLLGLRYMF